LNKNCTQQIAKNIKTFFAKCPLAHIKELDLDKIAKNMTDDELIDKWVELINEKPKLTVFDMDKLVNPEGTKKQADEFDRARQLLFTHGLIRRPNKNEMIPSGYERTEKLAEVVEAGGWAEYKETDDEAIAKYVEKIKERHGSFFIDKVILPINTTLNRAQTKSFQRRLGIMENYEIIEKVERQSNSMYWYKRGKNFLGLQQAGSMTTYKELKRQEMENASQPTPANQITAGRDVIGVIQSEGSDLKNIKNNPTTHNPPKPNPIKKKAKWTNQLGKLWKWVIVPIVVIVVGGFIVLAIEYEWFK